MKTIAIDIQPQRTYSELCPLELPIAGAIDIVKELNHQASLADYRVLVKDSHAPTDLQLRKLSQPDLSSSINKSHAVIGTEGFQLLPGLPNTTDYNFLVHLGTEPDIHCCGACFHDMAENMSTGLIEWLKSKNTSRIIIGGLPLDYTLQCTVRQLCWHGDWEVLVNLGASRGFNQEDCDKAIRNMQKGGARIIHSANQISHHHVSTNTMSTLDMPALAS